MSARLSSGKRPEHPNTRRGREDSGPEHDPKRDGSTVRVGQQADPNTTEQPNTTDEALLEARRLLNDPQLLDHIKGVIRARGYAGDLRPPMLVYFALTSRLLENARPINLAIVSPSATGKNKTVDGARELVPADAVHFFSAGSQKALIYSTEDFKHRVVIFAEADSIPDEGAAASAVRALFEDNRLVYEVPERVGDSFVTRRIEKAGPTGLITTSLRRLPQQMNTRVLEVWIDDSPEQTREVLRAHARAVMPGAASKRPSTRPFVELQRWLKQHGSRQVIVPFADQLSGLVPVHEVRIRRDFKQLLSVIQTSALLHQQQRERTEAGEIIATLDDYAYARWLLSSIFDAITDDTVTPAIRATVEAVPASGTISQSDLVRKLGRSKSAVSDRASKAVSKGWLIRAGGKGQVSELRRGEPLPEADTALPTVAVLAKAFGCSAPEKAPEQSPEHRKRAASGRKLRNSRNRSGVRVNSAVAVLRTTSLAAGSYTRDP